ncbi:MAG: glycosyltransferase [Methanocellales archaeon]|nr:glycosyltransferase [Methanocellales archaeon]MDD3421539.1 glycosyltransferase [Methanocellales archaeon]MDD4898711.1 glycosyltransferase [Methanocellales archaeon]MDD5447081.1 glycosyltransferase [Methanocellales archaeon]
MVLTPILQEQVDNIGPVDVVVGIPTKDVESTIIHTLNVVGMGLQKCFEGAESLVVISNGFSSDKTKELAKMFSLPPAIKKIVTDDVGRAGKGSAVRTTLEIAMATDAKCIVLVDGDLLSISPSWVGHLAEPILFGADLVVPCYTRDKYDGVITNNIIYPLIRSVFRANVRQPIGGDFALSRRLAEMLLKHPMFPHHFGIDIFITTIAAAEQMEIRESLLGLKIHSSVTKYIDTSNHLSSMFQQVVGTQFDLIEHYEESWKNVSQNITIQRRRDTHQYRQEPVPVKVDPMKLIFHFKERFKKHKDSLDKILPKDVFKKVHACTQNSRFDPETWAKTVYHMAAAYKRAEKENRIQILDVLHDLWLGRYAHFVLDTQDMSTIQVEVVIKKQAETFKKLMPYLKEIY